MSDIDLNLQVLTEYLNKLKDLHEEAGAVFLGSERLITDVASKVEYSHGLACFRTANAMKACEDIRMRASQALIEASEVVASKLEGAATNYNDVDYRCGTSMGVDLSM